MDARKITASGYVRITGDHPEGWAEAVWDLSLTDEARDELDAFMVEFREKHGGRQRRSLVREIEDIEVRA